MHIHQFAECCDFSEAAVGGTLPAAEEYRVKNEGSIADAVKQYSRASHLHI